MAQPARHSLPETRKSLSITRAGGSRFFGWTAALNHRDASRCELNCSPIAPVFREVRRPSALRFIGERDMALNVDLAGELKSGAFAVTAYHLRHLTSLGITWETIGELGRNHYSLGVATCTKGEDELYYLSDGSPHLILPVYEEEELVDLCAFQSRNPTKWLLRVGSGWALGLEHGLGRHTCGDPVPLAVSPLEWLQRGAEGLCVLDWSAPEVHYLNDIDHIVCSSDRLSKHLRAALSKPVRFPKISIEEARLAA